MDHADHIRHLRGEAGALVVAIERVPLDAPVPSCPDWDAAKLVRHTGTTHRWAAAVARTGEPVAPKTIDLGLPDEAAGLPAWFAAGADHLAGVLEDLDPEQPCWSWGEDQHARFWSRRMALETAVHRVDAELTAGVPPAPVDAALASDGLDELWDNAPKHPKLAAVRGGGESVHLHATDAPGEWLVRRGATGLEVTREHAKGDVAARGTASDLFLATMGRVPLDRLEVFGDRDLLVAFREDLTF